jgi:hypothetical protein
MGGLEYIRSVKIKLNVPFQPGSTWDKLSLKPLIERKEGLLPKKEDPR